MERSPLIRKLILTLLLLAPASVFAQTAAIQGYCDKGGTKTVTQGLNSTNYAQGDNPHCQITVYLTGTQTKATLTADKDGTPLPNPFTAGAVGSLLPGKWIFWAAVNQGYDVVASGGDAPNTYSQPVTLCSDCYPGSSFSGQPTFQTNTVNNLTQSYLDLDNSTNCTFSNTSGGHVTVDCGAGITPQVVPPIGGQYAIVYATTATLVNDEAGGSSVNATSGFLRYGCVNGIGLCTISPTTQATWTGFALPSYVNPANVTAVYADAVTSATPLNGAMPSGGANITTFQCLGTFGAFQLFPATAPTSPWATLERSQLLTGITGSGVSGLTCTAILGASNSFSSGEVINITAIRLLVYYTGTAPPVDSRVQIVPPLLYNADLNQLSYDPLARGYLQPETALTLPSASAHTGEIWEMTDGTSSSDCTTGGGSTVNLCRSNGTTWNVFSSGGGGSGVLSINGTPGAFTFSGTGVSCSGTTCTFSVGGITGSGTVGYLPLWTPSTTSLGNSALQDTGSSLVYHGTGTQHALALPSSAGGLVTPVAGNAGIGTDSSGLWNAYENGGSWSRLCTVGNGLCSGTVGVTSIDTQTGAFTFGGTGVSHVGTAYTFSGGGGVNYSNYGGINVFGDSISQGTGSSNFMGQGLSATGYAQMLIADFGGNGQDFGLGGDQAADMSMKVYANANPTVSTNFITALQIGTNDAVHYGLDANKENIFTRAVEASAAWPLISDANKFYTNDTNYCTQAGTWGVDAGAARGAISSSTNASSLTCNVTVPTGSSAIYYGYAACDSWSPGQASILIDGSSPSNDATVLSYGQGGASISTANGATCSMFLARYPVSTGSHTFKITVSSASGFVEPRWIGTPVIDTTSPAAPIGYVSGVPWTQGGTTSDVYATYDGLVSSAISTMHGDGLPAYFVDIRNGTNTHNSNTTTPLNNSTDYAGGVEGNVDCPASAFLPLHPNSSIYWSRSCGHGHIAANFETAIGIKAGGPQGSNVVYGRTLSPNGFLATSNVGTATGTSAGFGISDNGDLRIGSLAGQFFDGTNLHIAAPTTAATMNFDFGNSPSPGVTPTITTPCTMGSTGLTCANMTVTGTCTGCGGSGYPQVTSLISGASGANSAGITIQGGSSGSPSNFLNVASLQLADAWNTYYNGTNWITQSANGAGAFRMGTKSGGGTFFQMALGPSLASGATFTTMDTTSIAQWCTSAPNCWFNPGTANPTFPSNAVVAANPSANWYVDTSGISHAAGVIDTALTTGTSPICPNGTGGALTTVGCTAASGTTVASSETVTFSATPTFSTSFNVSYIVLTGNITSFTLGAGGDGQAKTLTFCQDATGSRTVTAPSNVHGFMTIGATASKCSSQHFNYSTAQTAWLADSAGVINE